MATVYIIYSKEINRYYVGSCYVLESRLQDHITGRYKKSFTRRATDWKLYFKIDELNLTEARAIEKHIKRMKSRKYFENLKRYPDITKRLRTKYCAGSFR